MISQVYFISQRGTVIIRRQFRPDLISNSHQLFYRFLQLQSPSPFFNVEGINFVFISVSSIFLVAATRTNTSPALIVEALRNIAKTIEEFLGQVSEQMIMMNTQLVNEVLDECIDYGYPQVKQKKELEDKIVSEVERGEGFLKKSWTYFTSLTKSLFRKTLKEIFFDISESYLQLTKNGNVNHFLDGQILVNQPTDENMDFQMGIHKKFKENFHLQSYNFHSCVNYSKFQETKKLYFSPPKGSYPLMKYKSTNFPYPSFRLNAQIKVKEQGHLQLVITPQSNNLPKDVKFLEVRLQTPPEAKILNSGKNKRSLNEKNRIQFKILPSQPVTIEFYQKNLKESKTNIQMEVFFEVMYSTVSGMQIKYVKCINGHKIFPWVRYKVDCRIIHKL